MLRLQEIKAIQKTKKKFATNWPKKDTKFWIHMIEKHDMIMIWAKTHNIITRQDRAREDVRPIFMTWSSFDAHLNQGTPVFFYISVAVKCNSVAGNQAHLLA